jgi:hypothetical protein
VTIKVKDTNFMMNLLTAVEIVHLARLELRVMGLPSRSSVIIMG